MISRSETTADREVIIVPDEGYIRSIYRKAAEIYEQTNALLIISGKNRDPKTMGSYGLKRILENFFRTIPIENQIKYLISIGVDSNDIRHENKSLNTADNALESLLIVKEMPNIEIIHLIGATEAMPRKFLTFRKTAKRLNIKAKFRLHCAWDLFPLGLTLARTILIPSELFRIYKYRLKGDL